MRRIKKDDLSSKELEVLEFLMDTVGYSEDGKQFIYSNLFRDENGVAYCPSKSRKKLLAICVD